MKELNIDPKKIELLMNIVVQSLPQLALALITLIVGLILIKLIQKSINHLLTKKAVEPSLTRWLVSMLSITLKVMLLIAVAGMVGIQTTSFIAILGAAGLAVGLALQGSLSNFAGGILILVFKPFKVGDFIAAQGEEGTVDTIDVFYTYLNTFDNKFVVLPNGPLANGNMVNYTKLKIRRVDIPIGISYSDDFKKAEKALLDLAHSDSVVLKEPPPFVGVKSYGDNSIDLTYRLWCKTDDYWPTFFKHNQDIKPAFDKAGISIPFPQRDVHLYTQKP